MTSSDTAAKPPSGNAPKPPPESAPKSAPKSAPPLARLPSPARRREELAFLPAALEIVETPPSPIGRSIAWTLIALFCLAVGWSIIGEVDIIASATGKIVPNGRVKVIQPFETSVVREIRVTDGQSVKAGDVLIELDPTLNDADLAHIQGDLLAQKLEVARLRALLSDADDPLTAFVPPEGANPVLVNVQKQLLLSQIGEQRAKLAALDGQKAQKEADRATAEATIARFEATIPLLQQIMAVYKTLSDNGNGTKLQYLQTMETLVDKQHELLAQRSQLKEAEAAVAAIVQTRAQAVAEFRRTLSDQLATAEAKAAGLEQDLVKAQERAKLQILTAPVDGVVQQLAVHTVRGIVTPAQALLEIVPADAALEIEAMVSNRDIGFVHAGQDAEVKIDTFNFTKYGLLHGRVISVSQDAIARDKPRDRNGDVGNGDNASSEPKGQELDYMARVALDHTEMQVDERMVTLSPGMAVTVEIKLGSRRIISYLLSPLLRYGHDSLREQ